MKKLVILRRASQAFFLIAVVYTLWSTTYPLTGLIPPDAFFKIDPLVMIITSISERLILPGIEFAFFMLVLTLILGRFFCGWVCPLGSCLDMAGSIGRKAHPENDVANKGIRTGKFIILACVALIAVVGIQTAWVFDPIVIMARLVSLNLIPAVTSVMKGAFVFLIRDLGLGAPVTDVYHSLKSSVLGVKVYYFSHSFMILCLFLAVCALSLIRKRLWCRAICPLGAIYALAARHSLLTRVVGKCTHCMVCKPRCRTGAILDDASYVKGECVMCMDCIYDCPQRVTRFAWVTGRGKETAEKAKSGVGISRGQFLSLLSVPVILSAIPGPLRKKGGERAAVIRPPAALKEERFVDRCVRCGNCMKVCITNGLQPVLFESGLEGIWTPQLVPEIGYCEYNCTLCGNTCPTGAIPKLSLEQKQKTRLGLAVIDHSLCLPWAYGKECIVCEEHCPVYSKAIKLVTEGGISKPYVDKSLCVGCGICQNKCPVRPKRAIRVSPARSDRT